MSDTPITRELLLSTHLPQCSNRVTEDFASSIVKSVRLTSGNSQAICESMHHYLLYDRVVLGNLNSVGLNVFESVQLGWKKTFPNRCKAKVTAISASQIEVLCPVSTPAAIMAALAPELKHVSVWANIGEFMAMSLLQLLLLMCLYYNFIAVYNDWLDSGEMMTHLFLPARWMYNCCFMHEWLGA